MPHTEDEWATVGDDDGLERLVASRFFLDPSRISIDDWNGAWVEYTVWFDLGDDVASLRTEIERILRLCGPYVAVFVVLDEAGSVLLTEEEFWNEPNERTLLNHPKERNT